MSIERPAFITVTGSGVETQDKLEAYLYGHTTVAHFHAGGRFVFALLVTESDHPRFHAQYQAERLGSGLWGTRIHESLVVALAEYIGNILETPVERVVDHDRDEVAHRVAEALEAAAPDGVVIGETERAIIREELAK